MVSQTSLNDSTTIKQQINFAMRLCELKEYSQAESYLRTLLSQHDRNASVWYLLSFIAAQKQEYTRAIQLIQKAITINPKEATFYHNLGNIYTNKKVFDKAIKCYRKAISLKPENDSFYRSLGLVNLMKGDLVNANFSYGMANEKQGNLSEAIKFYQKVISAQPDWVLPYDRLANIYQGQNKLEQAIECYQQILGLEPERANSYYQLGIIYQKKSLPNEAVYFYEKAIAIQPQHGDAYFNLSIIYHQQGNFERALQACHNALKYQNTGVNSFYPLDSTLPDLERTLKQVDLIPLIPESVKKDRTKNESPNQTNSINSSSQNNDSNLSSNGLDPSTSEIELKLTALQTVLKERYRNREIQSQNLTQNSSLIKYEKKIEAIIPVVDNTKNIDLESEFSEVIEEENYEDYDSIYHQHSIFQPLEKKIIARRILNNKYRFFLVIFVNPEQQQNLEHQLKFLNRTKLSYIFFQTPPTPTAFTKVEGSNYINYSKPNFFASIYEDVQSKKIDIDRDVAFTHLVYLDCRCVLNVGSQIIDLLKRNSDRCIDFSVYNWLQKIPQSTIEQLDLESKFLISCSSLQLYSLSQQSLWLWEVWQQAIIEYTSRITRENTQVFPGDESFLDYSWNSILCHIPKIKSAWLKQNNSSSQWTPLARTLVN